MNTSQSGSPKIFVWKDRERLYEVYSPQENPKNMPLVFVLHGAGGNAAYARRMADIETLAEREKFLVVYPYGTGLYKHAVLTWNAFGCCGYANQHDIDDVGFLEALLENLSNQYPIDANRVYMTGISNGAMMCHRFACEKSHKIAAIAPVAGTLNDFSHTPNRPVSVIAFHGTADKHAPYNGGKGPETKFPREDQPVNKGIKYWVESNGCHAEADKELCQDYKKEKYSSGKENTEVVLYTIQGGGHSWPGGRPGMHYGNLDPPSDTLCATDLIWDFFKAHPRKG